MASPSCLVLSASYSQGCLAFCPHGLSFSNRLDWALHSSGRGGSQGIVLRRQVPMWKALVKPLYLSHLLMFYWPDQAMAKPRVIIGWDLNATSWWKQCKEFVVIFNPQRKKPNFKQRRPGFSKFFLKGQDSKYFRLAGLGSLQFWYESNHRQYIYAKGCGCFPVKLYLQKLRSCYTIVWGLLPKTIAGWDRLLRVKTREESSQMLIPWSPKLRSIDTFPRKGSF